MASSGESNQNDFSFQPQATLARKPPRTPIKGKEVPRALSLLDLDTATSSLKVRAQSYFSYSRFQLHVNGGTSFSNLGTLTGFATGV